MPLERVYSGSKFGGVVHNEEEGLAGLVLPAVGETEMRTLLHGSLLLYHSVQPRMLQPWMLGYGMVLVFMVGSPLNSARPRVRLLQDCV